MGMQTQDVLEAEKFEALSLLNNKAYIMFNN